MSRAPDPPPPPQPPPPQPPPPQPPPPDRSRSEPRRLPPRLAEHPRGIQVLLVGVVPVVYGAITGLFLGISEGTYLVLSIIGILGGIGAGFDHLGPGAGARRGILAGLLFGGSILIAHEIHGADAKADLPDPEVLLILVTTVLGAAFGATGGLLRRRLEPIPSAGHP